MVFLQAMNSIDLNVLAGPVLVTCAYFLFWYYLLLIRQRGTKVRLRKEYNERGETFDRYFGQDAQMLAADRAVINTQEQMVPFLFSLWMYGLLVSSFYATLLGGIYVVLRAIYPFLLGRSLSKINSKKVAFVTFPCYGIIFTFIAGSAMAVIRHLLHVGH